jgi:predicted DCC family thiol-disulfide oxidoreductase YuxK
MTVADAPDGLWLFDGVCNVCSSSVRLALMMDRKGVIRFTPIQSNYGRALAIAHCIDPDQPQSFLFFDQGRALDKSAAVLALLARMPAPWRWLGVTGLLPAPWRDAAYDWIAANRYRLLGKRKTCMLPTPAQRARFLLEPPGR